MLHPKYKIAKMALFFLTLLVSNAGFALNHECPSQNELKKALLKKQTVFSSKDGLKYKIEGTAKDKIKGTYPFTFVSVIPSRETISAVVTCNYTSKNPAEGNILLVAPFQSSDKENFAFRPEDPDLWMPEGKEELCKKSSEKCKFAF